MQESTKPKRRPMTPAELRARALYTLALMTVSAIMAGLFVLFIGGGWAEHAWWIAVGWTACNVIAAAIGRRE